MFFKQEHEAAGGEVESEEDVQRVRKGPSEVSLVPLAYNFSSNKSAPGANSNANKIAIVNKLEVCNKHTPLNRGTSAMLHYVSLSWEKETAHYTPFKWWCY